MTAEQGRKRRRGWRTWLPLLGIGILAVTLLIFGRDGSREKFVWLTPRETPFRNPFLSPPTMKQKVIAFIESWTKKFRGKRPEVRVRLNLLEIPAGQSIESKLGGPVATNASGMRAWILAPGELEALFPKHIRLARDFEGFSLEPAAEGKRTHHGILRNIQIGKSINSRDTMALRVETTPRTIKSSFSLEINVVALSSTNLPRDFNEFMTPKIDLLDQNKPGAKTNFTVAYRAMVPDGGTVVILCDDRKAGKQSWFTASPHIVE